MSSRIRASALVTILLLIAVASADSQRLPSPAPRPAYVPGELVVGFEQGADVAAIADVAAAIGGTPARRIPQINAQVFRVPPTDTVQSLAERVTRLPGVRYAEPNYLVRLLLAPPNDYGYNELAKPNDPGYNELDTLIAPWPELGGEPTHFQWTLHVIEALGAWGIYPNRYYTHDDKPTNAPKIAVVDSGIDYGGTDGLPHLDFINAGGTSPDALQGGQIDIANGRNLISGAPDPTNFSDDNGHGTAVASIAAASANNGMTHGNGIAGVGYHAQILAVKVIGPSGEGTDADLATGIIYAADHGALIINVSAGTFDYSQALQDAVDYAWDRGSLVVAAAGNDGEAAGGNNRPNYPAANAGVLAVGASTWYLDLPASYSNTGYYLAVTAPAGDPWEIAYGGFWLTWSAAPTEDVPLHELQDWYGGIHYYLYADGTSLAAPCVSGLASLYAAYRGITQSTPGGQLQIWKAICRGCDNIIGAPAWEAQSGWGRVNARWTLEEGNHRGSALGGLAGQVKYRDTVVANATVGAIPDGGSTPVATATSHSDGMYHLANLTPGLYDVTATYFGESQTVQNMLVEAGYDVPRICFNIGGATPGNTAPVLSWLGSGGYVSDGVDPDLAEHLTRCTFKVKYSDADGDAPASGVTLHLLRNGREITASPFQMNVGVVNDWTAGAVFRLSRRLRWGDYSYYFEASDGTSSAIGEPTNEQEGPEIITPPVLQNPRVIPATGDATTRFRYRVDYSSLDGKPATWVQLQLRVYDPATGWERHAWRRRNIASGTSPGWVRQLGTLYPDATEFRYRYRALKGGSGCRLIAATDWTTGPSVTGGAAAVVLSSVAAAPTKAGGAEIVFTLSAPADVQATVLNIAGRPIRKMAPVAGVQGLNTLLWDGKSNGGLRVPGGTYLVEMTASSADGSRSRGLAPLRLNR